MQCYIRKIQTSLNKVIRTFTEASRYAHNYNISRDLKIYRVNARTNYFLSKKEARFYRYTDIEAFFSATMAQNEGSGQPTTLIC